MNTIPKVNVLMATYNGEKHIIKQLDSIITQTYDNITIYIRDDGSTDNTVAVVRQYIKDNTSNREIVLLDNGNKNLKCPMSFYEIIKNCPTADYYSLCDQDDYWYPNKIQWAVDKLEQEQTGQPLLYFSACDYQTADGTLIRKSPLQSNPTPLEHVIYHTPGSGFTIVFNEAIRQKMVLNATPSREMHDRWLIRGAVCFGKTIYDSRSTAAHIRHEEAVTAEDSDNMHLLVHFIKEELFGSIAPQQKSDVAYFYKTFENELKPEHKKILQTFAADNTAVLWFKKLFYPKRLRTRLPGEIALRFLFFLGRL